MEIKYFSSHLNAPELKISFYFQHKANPQNLDHEGRTCMSYVRALERTLDNSSDSMEMQKLLEVLEQASISNIEET